MTDFTVRLGARKTAFCHIARHINCTGDHKSYICYHVNWRSVNIWPHVVLKLTSLDFCRYYEEVGL